LREAVVEVNPAARRWSGHPAVEHGEDPGDDARHRPQAGEKDDAEPDGRQNPLRLRVPGELVDNGDRALADAMIASDAKAWMIGLSTMTSVNFNHKKAPTMLASCAGSISPACAPI
jgi:hypothetical protein